jgi:molecular chaperone GrpE (heat shock protein)
MADNQNSNDSPKNSNQEDQNLEGLSIENVGIPLGDFDDEPIFLDEVISEGNIGEDIEGKEDIHAEESGGASFSDSVSEDIYTEILEDKDTATLPLVSDDVTPESDDLLITEELDPDALPLSELENAGEKSPSVDQSEMGSHAVAWLDKISQQLVNIEREFQTKLKYDAHKEKIIDSLHQELQEYKENLVRKLSMNTYRDIIKLIDDIKKMIHHFDANQVIDEDPGKVLRFLKTVPSDLEDILTYQGVTAYSSCDDRFNPARQRMMHKVPTSQEEKDKTIAEHLRPGYAHEELIIRPELVNVYVFNHEADCKETRSSDE